MDEYLCVQQIPSVIIWTENVIVFWILIFLVTDCYNQSLVTNCYNWTTSHHCHITAWAVLENPINETSFLSPSSPRALHLLASSSIFLAFFRKTGFLIYGCIIPINIVIQILCTVGLKTGFAGFLISPVR